MAIESPYTTIIVQPKQEVTFDPASWLGGEVKTIEIGPIPKIPNTQAHELMVKAVGILGRAPEEIFVGYADWPFGLESHCHKRPCVYAGVTFYLTCDLGDFFACL